jgi:hypothetical protein
VLASTRPVFADQNASLNMAFYRDMFRNPRLPQRLGLALMNAKKSGGSNINNQKYVLLSDPTMRLAVPRWAVRITSITPDTIKALSKIKVSGQVEENGVIMSTYNGKALVKAFDSQKQRNLITELGTSIQYRLPGNTIFRGSGSVINGKFDVEFVVPKDITYGGNLGRVSVYVVNSQTSGNGYQNNLVVDGTAQILDNEGPQIRISLENEELITSGFVSQTPRLKIALTDTTSGINLAGAIGHDITMIVDDEIDNKIELTDLFQYNEGSYSNGYIVYDFANYQSAMEDEESNVIGLGEGSHSISIKAWDNSNNSSESRTDVYVVSGSELHLKDVLNYPNPFDKQTTFTFLANQACTASVKIYTVAGRLIQKFDEFPLNANDLAAVFWNGTDADGDPIANGVYLYKVTAKANVDGKEKTVEVVQKLIKMK